MDSMGFDRLLIVVVGVVLVAVSPLAALDIGFDDLAVSAASGQRAEGAVAADAVDAVDAAEGFIALGQESEVEARHVIGKLRISGTVVGGRHDPIGRMEYFLHAVTAGTTRQNKWFQLGPLGAMIDLADGGPKIARGETRQFCVEVPLRFFGVGEARYVSFAWMEHDLGLGVGSVDTVILATLGGAHDRISSTEWIPLESLIDEPVTFELEPRLRWRPMGGSFEMTVQFIPNSQ